MPISPRPARFCSSAWTCARPDVSSWKNAARFADMCSATPGAASRHPRSIQGLRRSRQMRISGIFTIWLYCRERVAQVAGARVAKLLAAEARRDGYGTMALVSVNGSQGFWERQGFGVRMEEALGAKLSSYGGEAVYMERTLAGENFARVFSQAADGRARPRRSRPERVPWRQYEMSAAPRRSG